MSKCFRCGGDIPEPQTIEGALERELEWRNNYPDEPDEQKVLVCQDCVEEIDEQL